MCKDKLFTIAFELSSMDVTVPPLEPVTPTPTLGEAILENLYKDEAHEDVHFVFDTSLDMSATAGEFDISPGNVSDIHTDTKMSVENQKDLGTDTGNLDESRDGAEPHVKRMRVLGQNTIGAHKLMLCQWPYFKAMFEGGFSEGGPGNKTIRIKDASPKAFHLLLRFMYTGKLLDDAKPKTIYMDPLNKYMDASWESVYLLAHRYDIQELTAMARSSILSELKLEETVSFLFRTAYLFMDLREPVIRYMATSCGSILASKSIRLDYMDHPEGVQIFGELFEQLYAIKK